MSNFNPDILLLARGSRGKSQADIAKQMSWSQGKASKVEHGLIDVTEDEVRKLAQYLEYPAEIFSQHESAIGFGSCCLYHRKRATTAIRAINQLHDEINIRRMQIARLLSGIELRNEINFPSFDIDEYGTPEECARMLRAAWQLPRGPIKNLIDVVEAAGGIVMFVDFPVRKIDAVSQKPIGLPPLFFLDRQKPVDRYRYSLAHEIGHVVMHETPTPDAEREADRFAAEFLMPADEIRHSLRGLTIDRAANLKLRWRTAMQAIIRRARDVGAISASKYQSLCVRISQLGYRKNEPNRLEPEMPRTLMAVVDEYLSNRQYTISELSIAALSTEERFRIDFLNENPPLRIVK